MSHVVIASLILISRREALFDQKLELCSQIFNFEDVSGRAISVILIRTQVASLKKEKEMKRQTLLELVDYVNTSAGQKIFTEASMPVLCCVLNQSDDNSFIAGHHELCPCKHMPFIASPDRRL